MVLKLIMICWIIIVLRTIIKIKIKKAVLFSPAYTFVYDDQSICLSILEISLIFHMVFTFAMNHKLHSSELRGDRFEVKAKKTFYFLFW